MTEATKNGQKKRLPQSFTEAARNLKTLESEVLVKSEKRAWLVTYSAGLLCFFAIIAMLAAIFFRVEPEPTVIEVDKSSGITRVLRSVADTKDSYNVVIQKHFLALYVNLRESYDWYNISTAYKSVKLMSSNDVSATYALKAESATSPLKTYKNKKRVITRITSITFVDKVAQIRFTKQTIASNGFDAVSAPKVPWIATVSYSFDGKALMTPRERVLNPLGFKVYSYQAQPEVIQQ